MGADKVIVIDLKQEEVTLEDNSSQGSQSIWGAIFDCLTPERSLLYWITHRPDKHNYLRNLTLYAPIDIIYIHPDLNGRHVASFGHNDMATMVDIGNATARRHKKQLLDFRWRTVDFQPPTFDHTRLFP
jgi:hypothetical protein